MRQLFFLLITFFSLAALAQTPTSTQYLGAPKTLIQVRGPLRVDSLGSGKSDTTTYKPIGVNAAGDFRRMSAWVGSAGGVGGTGIDSMIIIRDSIFIYTRDTVYYVGTSTPTDTTAIHDRLNDLDARRDTLSITQPDSLHIIICQPTIGRCDTLEWSGSSGGGTSITYPYTARKYLNGYGAFPTLNSDSLDEGSTNLFFTNARVRAALSAGAPLTYNSTTGAFGITQATTSTDGYLSSTDWNTFNGKQAALVSGTNIKTINGNSLLGSGDVTISGGTLNNVGTGYDVAVQGTSNVKRLQPGFGVIFDSTTTPNTIIAKADTSEGKLATRWYAQNNIGYDTTKVGTYAQRIAITGLYKGYQFFQTNERVGLWIYGNGSWSFYPSRFVMAPQNQTWFSTSVSGTGAGAAYTQTLSQSDSSRPNVILVQTGTTSTGYAGVTSTGFNNTGTAPYDAFASPTKHRYVLVGRIKIFDAPTTTDNYRMIFGYRSTGAVNNDSTLYGAYFRMSFHNSSNIQTVIVDNSNSVRQTGEGTAIANLVGRFVDYVIVFTNRRAWYYIDGTYVGSLDIGSGPTPFGAGGIVFSVAKVSGTTNRYASLSECYLYQFKEE